MRPSHNETMMMICEAVAERSTCLNRKVGAVICIDDRVVSTGYNGAPKGHPHCIESGFCLRAGCAHGEGLDLCPAAHAEQNAIASAARTGVTTKGGTMYCTTRPCSWCAKLIVCAGITKVIYRDWYDCPLTTVIFTKAGISCSSYNDVVS